jgi:hypothetical protein
MLGKRLAAAVIAGFIGSASAETISWTDWTSAGTTAASGSLSIGSTTVNVGFSGALNPAAQTAGGTNYWLINSVIYTGGGVDNGPPDSDIIRLIGGTATGTQTLTFSQPLVDPVMAILSLGQPAVTVTYDFNAPFDVLNSGQGHWGGNPAGSLFEDPSDVLRGIEGHGIIRFSGTFSSISWTIPTAENWHGFQIGAAAVQDGTPAPEPASIALLGIALAGLALARRRRG